MVGCAICGSAPSSVALIIGRAIAGIGGAGIFSGCFIVVSKITVLRKRSLFMGLLGASFGIAAVIGPLLGRFSSQNYKYCPLMSLLRWCIHDSSFMEVVFL